MKSYVEDDLSGIRLIASDMDCTLLADDGSMPEDMPRRIRDLAGAGVTFAAASGRPLYTLREMFEETYDEMACIADNGAYVVCGGKDVYQSLIDPALVQEITDFTLSSGCGIPTICGVDACYIHASEQGRDPFFRSFYRKIAYLDSLDDLDAPVDKYTICFPDGDAADAFERVFAPAWNDRLSITCAGPTWIDIMNPGVDKGTGIARLCEHLGIDAADAIAIGDTDNDIEMLKFVGHGYLVANAEQRMERFANFRAPSNNDRGVAQVIDAVLDARRG